MPKDDTISFAEYVHTVRKTLKWNQLQLAQEFGVSLSTIGRWERAEAMPTTFVEKCFRSFCEEIIRSVKK
jgi:ribosome-binding protein aMBF1 (putative translation factor)